MLLLVTDDARTTPNELGGPRVRAIHVAILAGVDAGTESAPGGRCAIGTAGDNELVLHDPEVSRYHLELAPDPHGIAIKDLGSLNGTFLGAARVLAAVVPSGTHLTLGRTTIVVTDAQRVAKAQSSLRIASLIGSSPQLQEVTDAVLALASTGVSTLIQGETGTGKELVARAIHEQGPRRKHPFIVVDCGSLPATLVASELFGHERGAFTGADQLHRGAFEQADGGTVFLDEIGELPLAVQPSLLGVLERKRFRRVGGSKDLAVDVRVVAATNRDLRIEANRGTFRPDLYFRLAVARVALPPLRERRQDIELLVAHFVEQVTGSAELGAYFGPQTLEALRAHVWSGNVRELRNVVERALTFGHVKFDTAVHVQAQGAELGLYRDARAIALAAFEQDYLTRLMAAASNNASEAARRASMDRPYLLSLLKKHGLR